MSYSNYYKDSNLLHASLSEIMGTRIDLLLFGEYKDLLNKCKDEILNEVVRLDKILNIFDPQSIVSEINSKAYSTPVKIPKDLFDIFLEAIDFAEKTKGLFDISLSDISALKLNADDETISFEREDIKVDFGGYAKGLALRKIKTIILSYDIKRCLVNFGDSSILAIGSHPHGDYWPIGIDNPMKEGEATTTSEIPATLAVLKLVDNAASISGNSKRNDKHIFNPFTKKYIDSNRIVAVVAEDPLVAEVLSTVLVIADIELGNEICSNFDIIEKQIFLT